MGARAAAAGQLRCNLMRGPFVSYSWDQPASAGIAGWEGRCGQTCVANLLKNRRPGLHVSPSRLIATGGGDLGPGSMPSTLLQLINSRSPRRPYQLRNERRIVVQAHPHNPIGCLLQWDENVLHWVTVVGTHGPNVIFNHWGRQQTLPRTEFDERWGFRSQGALDWTISRMGGLSPYTTLS